VSGILLNALLIYLVLKSADWIKEKVGIVGITLMERIFGIILIAIGMKIFISNFVLSIKTLI
jgi:multiple antibiotic resistance protein